jgi:hypothetical protein
MIGKIETYLETVNAELAPSFIYYDYDSDSFCDDGNVCEDRLDDWRGQIDSWASDLAESARLLAD